MIVVAIVTNGSLYGSKFWTNDFQADSTTVRELREMVQALTNIPTLMSQLVYNGRILDQDNLLCSSCFTIVSVSAVVVHVAPKGGVAALVDHFYRPDKHHNVETAPNDFLKTIELQVGAFTRTYEFQATTYTSIHNLIEMLETLMSTQKGIRLDFIYRGFCLNNHPEYLLCDFGIVESGARLDMVYRFRDVHSGPAPVVAQRRINRLLKDFKKALNDGVHSSLYPQLLEPLAAIVEVGALFQAVREIVGSISPKLEPAALEVDSGTPPASVKKQKYK